MPKIGLIAVDSKHPNLALMKIARYHKAQGDEVDWYNAMDGRYDIVYMSKIFTFTPDYEYYVNADQVEKGWTGYDIHKNLPDTIDRLQPDYSMYPEIDKRTAYGFLTRGCPNHCGWRVAPKKEGMIRPYMDIEEIAIEERYEKVLYDKTGLRANLRDDRADALRRAMVAFAGGDFEPQALKAYQNELTNDLLLIEFVQK